MPVFCAHPELRHSDFHIVQLTNALRLISFSDQEKALAQQLQFQSLQAEALFHYSVTGDSSFLLAPQRPLLAVQDEDGDTSVSQLHTTLLLCC